jgi:hypothetical protein
MDLVEMRPSWDRPRTDPLKGPPCPRNPTHGQMVLSGNITVDLTTRRIWLCEMCSREWYEKES